MITTAQEVCRFLQERDTREDGSLCRRKDPSVCKCVLESARNERNGPEAGRVGGRQISLVQPQQPPASSPGTNRSPFLRVLFQVGGLPGRTPLSGGRAETFLRKRSNGRGWLARRIRIHVRHLLGPFPPLWSNERRGRNAEGQHLTHALPMIREESLHRWRDRNGSPAPDRTCDASTQRMMRPTERG